MAIYTKKGDKGTTKLPYDVKSRSKSSCRVRSLGEIDELNSLIGAVISFAKQKRVKDALTQVQHDLFLVQMDLASKGQVFKERHFRGIGKKKVEWLESNIDNMQKTLKPLAKFILPGGSHAASLCQVARAVCRRAERELAGLSKKETVNADVAKYVNRLSDFLFMTARFINKHEREKERHPDYYKRLKK